MNFWKLCGAVLLWLASQNSLGAQEYGADFLTGDIRLVLHADSPAVQGDVTYSYRSSGNLDSIYLDTRMVWTNWVKIDGKQTNFEFHPENNKLAIPSPRDTLLHYLSIDFYGIPDQTVYRVGYYDSIPGNEQIWTQGQGKYSSRWVPSFDDMREKVIFSMQIEMDSVFEVIANGVLDSVSIAGEKRRWYYRMEKPMSSYLLAFAAGHFNRRAGQSASGIPLYWYLPKGKSFEGTTTYQNSIEIFDYLENALGVPYPWKNYKQVPLQEFMYAGMENTGTTFFSDRYLTDSISRSDRDYFNVNAHELAHQWFGNLVTEEDGRSHWLHEGFATFYAYKAEMEIRDAQAVWWRLFETARQLEFQAEKGEGKALTDPDAGSLIFYEKGAWALFALEEAVGSADFRKGITAFLKQYAFRNANIEEFLSVMEEASGKPLDGFKLQWLDSEGFPMEWAENYLAQQSPSVSYYLSLDRTGTNSNQDANNTGFSQAWNTFDLPAYRAQLIGKYKMELTPADYELVFQSSNPKVNASALAALGTLPEWSLKWATGLLNASSYDLREQALFAIWVAFPLERNNILNYTRNNGSLNSETFQQLWWVLSVYTAGYVSQSEQMDYIQNLQFSTAPGQPIEVRQNGYALLEQLELIGKQQLIELVLSSEHHSWQFRNYCRRLLDRQIAARPDKLYWEELLKAIPKTPGTSSNRAEFEPDYLRKKIAEL
ncbi:aminopeptidase N [Robiginitalea myxolifaciens]|uniref:Aminopeptidase N n=1 Tax=Robiginitalea myxolifaciens TaxID=400055 RepID=A0A1I6H001_9FLAO|nr:M1 family metallopeptidase [Robiginitalea myxolifaciens]SFR47768.1 aminopeptidase N [Robiginitalea myxolifaciens]